MATRYLLNIILLIFAKSFFLYNIWCYHINKMISKRNYKIFVSFYNKYVIVENLEKVLSTIVLSFQIIDASLNFWCVLSKKYTWADNSYAYESILYRWSDSIQQL